MFSKMTRRKRGLRGDRNRTLVNSFGALFHRRKARQLRACTCIQKHPDPIQLPRQQPNLFHCTQAGNTNTHNYSSSPPPLLFFFKVARFLRPGLPLQQGLIMARGNVMLTHERHVFKRAKQVAQANT
jgi:hypothetical protein